MPRDGAGNYTLAAGNPVVSGEVITPTWANPTMDDIAVEMTDSLSRSGKGGMLVAFENLDGTIGDPGITWALEPTTGFSRTAVNVMNASVGGIQSTRWIVGDLGFEIWDGTAWVKPLVNPVAGVVTFEAQAVFELGLLIANNQSLSARNFADDATIAVGRLSLADVWVFGNSTIDTAWRSLASANIQVNAITVADFSATEFKTTGIDIVLANGFQLRGRNFADTGNIGLVHLQPDDSLFIGASNVDSIQSHAQINQRIFITQTQVARWEAGGLIMEPNKQIFARNTADDGNLNLVTKSFGSDVIVYGDSLAGGLQYFGPTSLVSSHRWFVGGVESLRMGDDGLELPNNRPLLGRDLAGTGSFDLIFTDASDRLIIGDDARLKGAIYHASDHRFLGAEGDVFHSTSRALGSLLCRDLTDTDKKMGFRNPTRYVTNANADVIQDYEDAFVALNTGSTTLTFVALNLLTRITVLNATGNGTAAQGSGMTLTHFTGTGIANGNIAMSVGSVWDFFQITATIWYAWEIT